MGTVGSTSQAIKHMIEWRVQVNLDRTTGGTVGIKVLIFQPCDSNKGTTKKHGFALVTFAPDFENIKGVGLG